MDINKKMGLGFGVLMAIVASLAIVVVYHSSNTHRQFSYVIQHDGPVISNARNLLTLVVDMETGQRGFVITGQDEFLEPYHRAIASFSGLLEKEKQLVSSNPVQVERLEFIDEHVKHWQKEAAQPEISMRRKIGMASVDARHLQEILSQGKGKRLLDRFMKLGHEIEVSFSERDDWEGAYIVEVIEKCLSDRESGQRGFLITGKEEFLEKYVAGEQSKLPQLFLRLRRLISDRGRTDELSRKVDLLEELSAEWTGEAADPEIAARRTMNEHPETLGDVARLLETGTGKKTLDEIREVFSTFIEEEERLTQRRFIDATNASRLTMNLTIGIAFCSLIFGGLVATKITRDITRPVRTLMSELDSVSNGNLGKEIEVTSKDEIGALSLAFNRMRASLKQLEQDRSQSEKQLIQASNAAHAANNAKSEFLANMSHEIRTPMTAILGFNDILLDNASNQENVIAAQTVKKNGEFLIGLIDDILDLSKIEANKIEIENIECSVHSIVADVTSLMRVRSAAKGLPLEVRYDGSIPRTIQSDPTRLRQILINIVGNAIKFTESGSVQILTRLLNLPGEEPRLQFDVTDTGIGIAENKIESLFRPFTQADGSTTRQFGGTGLGLTITERLAKLLGGQIAVSSTVGAGSTFSVTVATGSLENVELTHNTAETVIETVDGNSSMEMLPSLEKRRILLVEDGPDNQRLIGFIMKKAGAEVTLAENGQIGFDMAIAAMSEGSPFDVILMDMQMPVLDGYEATRRLREHGYTLPIVALTAHAMATDRQKCVDAGCDDFATKPIDRKKLIELVASYAKRTESPDDMHTLVPI
jgi:signal transduction histidine kinase/AmiR/NasT family two-component response regulator